jgi:hypothetical protein
MTVGIADFLCLITRTTKCVTLNISVLNHFFISATTPDCLVHESGHYSFMLISIVKVTFLCPSAASVVYLLPISPPPLLLMSSSVECSESTRTAAANCHESICSDYFIDNRCFKPLEFFPS